MKADLGISKLGILLIAALFSLSSDFASAAPSESAPYIGDNFFGAPCHGTIKPQEIFDYTLRSSFPAQLALTENYHFSANVENLISGDTAVNALSDIDFTLTRWPNHHRALNSAIRARIRDRDDFLKNGFTSAECYLQRAINFSPRDSVSLMLYGNLLQSFGYLDAAYLRYEKAESINPDSIELKYNFGLLLVQMKQYEKAGKYASYVYSRGFPLPGLKRKLKKKGY